MRRTVAIRMARNLKVVVAAAVAAVVAALGAAGVWAAIQTDPGTDPAAQAGLDTFVGVTPTPALLDGPRSAGEALDSLHVTSPSVHESVAAWLKGDVAGAVGALVAEPVNCSDSGTRGVGLCQQLNVAPGTIVSLFRPVAGLPGFRLDATGMRAMVAHLIEGRSPRILLVAQDDRGNALVLIGVDPAKPYDYGGGPDSSPATVAFYLSLSSDGVVHDIGERSRSAPPLEPIRARIRQGEQWTVLGTAPELRTWESEIYATVEAQRREP
jgi:hypothetical protein